MTSRGCGLLSPAVRGKSMIVTRRLAAHDRLRDAAYHWARVAAPRDPASHDKYQSLRARGHGHGHARALRSVADRLLSVACAMLRARARFERRLEGGQANHRTGDRPSRPSAAPCRQCRSSSRSSRRLHRDVQWSLAADRRVEGGAAFRLALKNNPHGRLRPSPGGPEQRRRTRVAG